MFRMCNRSKAAFQIAFILFALDRLLKWLAMEGYSLSWVWGITFRFLANRGGIFGLSIPYLTFLSSLGIVVLIIYMYRMNFSPGLVFILLGGISNIIDRFVYGYVIDYIRVPFLPLVGHTYFNLADFMIDIGVVFWLWCMLKS
ncbi:MAG TPA: signal peptidase II [Candidatus Atribacteria bacterium]|nr:signal peptidase II [Candidatus Atribacteria bacterium]